VLVRWLELNRLPGRRESDHARSRSGYVASICTSAQGGCRPLRPEHGVAPGQPKRRNKRRSGTFDKVLGPAIDSFPAVDHTEPFDEAAEALEEAHSVDGAHSVEDADTADRAPP
jgi:hypothetical protein